MWSALRELLARRDLLIAWTQRDVRVRYKQAYLGAAWAVLQPASAALVFTAVFARFAGLPTDGIAHPVFYYAALLPWTLLATAVSFGVLSVVNNMHLVTTVYFPREILPLSALLVSLVDFCIAAVLFAAMLLAYRVPLTTAAWWTPFLLLVELMLIAGVVLFASAVTVFYRDLRFVVPLGLQLWMFLSPVIYPVSVVPDAVRGWYLLNPMAALIDSYRRVLLHGEGPEGLPLAAATALSAALLIGAYRYFKRAEGVFADLI